jgi:3-phenylpropionate/trans-cinnamate dioxygenase ferredoxin subunit
MFRVDHVFRKGQPQPVVKSSTLQEGKRIVVEFADGECVMILRFGGRLSAFSARCPHAGYRLEDGWYDSRSIACPGHGLEFDALTGASKGDCFRLKKFEVAENGGMIVLA